MSKIYENQDKLDIAAQAEADLNSHALKQGTQTGASLSSSSLSPLPVPSPFFH